MNDSEQIKRKIISFLKLKGPSLPVQIARELQISSIFAGAFLSELAKEKEIKISNLKVGGSPLYYLTGQESRIEKFSSYLPQKEKEAFLLLRNKKILDDKKQKPAIRVALRNLKDFALPLVEKTEQGQELFWRFYTTEEETIRGKLKPKKESKLKQRKIETIKQEVEKPLLILKPEKAGKPREQTENIITERKPQKLIKPREKPDFVRNILQLLHSGNIELLEELEAKKREFSGIIRITSQLGSLNFLCIAKHKKRITENDLRIAIQKSQTEKMPVLFLSPGEPNKKALSYLEQYSGIIKFKKIKQT